MQPTLCSKCKKNVAVVFISRMNEKGEPVNEGLCLQCAAKLGLPQVEDMMKRVDKPDPGMLRLLDISEEAFRTGPLAGAVLAQAYALAEGMGELLTRAILEGRVRGFLDQGESGVNLMLRGCMLRVDYDKKPGSGEPLAGGMVVELGEDEFVVVGTSCQLHVAPSGEGGVEAERYEEGCFRDGVWQRRRILNGDERHNIRCGTIPQMFRVRVFPL